MKQYVGHRSPSGTNVVVTNGDGPIRDLDPRQDLYNHGSSHFDWGYAGSSPAQLALALCADVLGSGYDLSILHIHQRVKELLLVQLTANSWVLTAQQVYDAIATATTEQSSPEASRRLRGAPGQTYVGTRLRDCYFAPATRASREPVTPEDALDILSRPYLSCCEHGDTFDLQALAAKHGVTVVVPKEPPAVILMPGRRPASDRCPRHAIPRPGARPADPGRSGGAVLRVRPVGGGGMTMPRCHECGRRTYGAADRCYYCRTGRTGPSAPRVCVKCGGPTKTESVCYRCRTASVPVETRVCAKCGGGCKRDNLCYKCKPPTCLVCRLAPIARGYACMDCWAMLQNITHVSRPPGRVPPWLEERIERYRQRAAQSLPLFEEVPCNP